MKTQQTLKRQKKNKYLMENPQADFEEKKVLKNTKIKLCILINNTHEIFYHHPPLQRRISLGYHV